MLSDYQREKLSTRFAQLDADGNGALELSDLQSLAQKLCDRLVPAENAAEQAEVMAGYEELWQLLASQADSDGDGTVSETEYLAAMDTGVLADETNYDASVGRIVTALFRALDADSSGQLDMNELVTMGAAYEMEPEDVRDLFGKLDTDGDGTVSLEEFQAAVRDFYMSDNPESAGRFIFAGAS